MSGTDSKSSLFLPGVQLFGLGFLTLFLELALIRYLAGNIWNLGYFPNLVLIAVFVGMGAGFLFHAWVSDRVSAVLFQLGFVMIVGLGAFVYLKRPAVPLLGDWKRTIGGELYFSAAQPHTLDTRLLPFLVTFALVVLIFILISQRTAKVFRRFRPLTAYTLDIAGSCAGILALMLASRLRLSASLWFGAAALLGVLAGGGGWRTRWIPLLPGLAMMALVQRQDAGTLGDPQFQGFRQVVWSPYQKIEYLNPAHGLYARITANGMPHQVLLGDDLLRDTFYHDPYVARAGQTNLPPIREVLVIGAGSGNDVAAALVHGVARVDAVEIDPVIAELGRAYHPANPYQDPRVNVVVDDGRAFMTQTKRRYDLIVFALTDSVVKISSLSQLRLENYLFTEESVARAFELLTDTGVVVFYNHYREEWLVDKLREMVRRVTRRAPDVRYITDREHREMFFTILTVGRYFPVQAAGTPAAAGIQTPTDDWPFPYLRNRGMPVLYQKACAGLGAGILLLMLGLHVSTRGGARAGALPPLSVKLAFLLMGTAFLLLETKSVIQFSLLFGTTWVNNSLVFLAVLVLVLAANWTAQGIRDPRWMGAVFVLLVLSCLVPVACPLGNLLQVPNVMLRFGVASLMTFSPIFFANLIFSMAFRDQAAPEHLFGWNLLGATAGGMLEYTGMLFGYSFLAVIVAACYVLVYVLLRAGLRSTGGGRVPGQPVLR